jgi:hypothetical protein
MGLKMSGPSDNTPDPGTNSREEYYVANHLTPTELAEEMNMKRRDVISKCMEMNVPIFNGRIDKTLFVSNLRQLGKASGRPQAAA